MDVQSHGQAAENTQTSSKVMDEGMAAGLIGAATVAVWFLILDLFQGRPLFTPNVLGTALFGGGPAQIASSADLPLSFRMILAFTWVHGMVFIAFGGVAAWLVRLAERDPNYGFGIALLVVVFMFGALGVSMVFAESVLHTLTIPGILIGNLLAVVAMGAYFRKRHPNLTFHP